MWGTANTRIPFPGCPCIAPPRKRTVPKSNQAQLRRQCVLNLSSSYPPPHKTTMVGSLSLPLSLTPKYPCFMLTCKSPTSSLGSNSSFSLPKSLSFLSLPYSIRRFVPCSLPTPDFFFCCCWYFRCFLCFFFLPKARIQNTSRFNSNTCFFPFHLSYHNTCVNLFLALSLSRAHSQTSFLFFMLIVVVFVLMLKC